ncbi:hypothetical protein BM221_005833 [Beauveria bassiana]|uniref:GPI anchored protein n=1 Tax=Beauveria bassiana TaxID=176275 RepID=A0A2N6NK58_BEABA|nr:hypothetical protein BM221_005833 [Beauveria bassiana]
MSLTYKALVVAAALAQLTGAFDRNDPLDSCPPAARTIIENQSAFNSTGETSFKLLPASSQSDNDNDDWHLALAFRDERAQNTLYSSSQTRQSLGVIVSVPERFPGSEAGKQTSLCVYRLEQQSAANANEQASCTGILSDACISALNSVPAASDGSCPVPDIAGACGDAKVVGSTTTPVVFNNTLCSTNATIPHSDAIPDGYQNYITFASGELNRTDDSRTSFTVYNEHIVQPVPILLTAKLGAGAGGNATIPRSKLLCLAPSKVVQGSRTAVVTAAAGGSTAASLLGAAKPVLVISLLTSILAVAL